MVLNHFNKHLIFYNKGSGKTASFLIPIINSLLHSCGTGLYNDVGSPEVLVLTPTRELALQVLQESQKLCYLSFIKTCNAYGGSNVLSQIIKIQEGCNILVATPGRLLDFVSTKRVSLKKIKYLFFFFSFFFILMF